MLKFFIVLINLLLMFSCTNKSELITRLEIYELGKKYDESIKLVLAEEIGGGPICEGRDGEVPYGKGCQRVFVIQIAGLELRCIEFNSLESAKLEASKIQEYYYKNWVFDEVVGEPPLESFVTNAFGAALGK
jgi:hypothetical protein